VARESKRHRFERRFGRADRLIDRALNGKWAYPSWYKPENQQDVEGLRQYKQQVVDDLGRAVVIVADNVCEYFYASNPKEEWDVGSDFPCCAPPHDLMFIEMRRPSRILSEGKIISSANLPELWGWLFKFNTIDEVRERLQDRQFKERTLKNLHHQLTTLAPKVDLQAIKAACQSGGIDGIGELGPHEQAFFMLSLQYRRLSQGTIEPSEFPEDAHWAAEGELIISAGDKVSLMATTKILIAANGRILHRPIISILGGLQASSEINRDLCDGLNPMSFPAFLTLSFMHCKNVLVSEALPDAKLNRLRAREGLKPFLRYCTVDIEPLKKVLKTEGQIESVGLRRALHIVRGHFSTYSEQKPLFGKVAGTFWIPSHVRGTVEGGVVASDYQVGAPRQKSTV
jgi:hypothetical protein